MSKSTPTRTRRPLARHQLDREQRKNREHHECRGSESGMEKRSRVNKTLLLLPAEVEQFRVSPVVPSRRLASSSCRQAARTPDELRRRETRHLRGRMRMHELAREQRTFLHRRHGRLWRKQEGLPAKEDIMRHRRVCQRQTGASTLSKCRSTTRLRVKSLRRRRRVGRSLRLKGLWLRGLRIRRLRR